MSDENDAGYPQSFFGQGAWTFYSVQNASRLVWLCVVTPEVRTYVYIPDSGRFHINNGVYVDYVWDNDLTYVAIGIDEARDLIEMQIGLLPPEMPSEQRKRYLTGEQLKVEDVFASVERAYRQQDVEGRTAKSSGAAGPIEP